MTVILLASLFAAYICHVDGQSSCTTPSGGIGSCKSIYQCDVFLDLVNKNDRTPDDMELLQKSQCGSQKTIPLLCCPETCYTPDNQPGRCVSIFTCSNLLNLLRLPVSQETIQYLQYSRCLDLKQYSVCCGPTPIMNLGPTNAAPTTKRPVTSFALPPILPSDLPIIPVQELPATEPATDLPVTISTLPPNLSILSPSTDAPSVMSTVNRKVDKEMNETSCRMPSGETGKCKSIRQCNELFGLANIIDRKVFKTNITEDPQCGFFGGEPAVCCPEQCYTPEGQLGICISIYACPHLTNILLPPTSKESIQYVQNSRCQDPDMYSVCCGPPPNLDPPPIGNCDTSVTAFPPDPRTECCGVDSRVDDELVAPGITRIDQYPWLVRIEYDTRRKISTFCVGSLISRKYVVTAANCLIGQILKQGTPVNIRLGEFNITNDGPDCVSVPSDGKDCTEGEMVIPIEQTITHPDYDPLSSANHWNDIGLIRMQGMAPYTDFIRPICLPQEDITLSPPPNMIWYAAGWGKVSFRSGYSKLKLHVDLPYVKLETCKLIYTEKQLKTTLWHKQVCAGGVIGKDTCKGDSGSPLMYQNGRISNIIGITSFGPNPCGKGIPGVYTKVYEYNTWIRRMIRP